ncbi:hypothetical protein BE221DRAFT_72409 [Ostreococcus tauri]|uniref:Uncharacterized protein n=1 Tax=Ostreococcus tauri TaxID=70448 RepID=A0A1Y5IC51_OSTTA|nr:hypothetical protein BE221DRAFT_72409 [Ostreococcus tauri]
MIVLETSSRVKSHALVRSCSFADADSIDAKRRAAAAEAALRSTNAMGSVAASLGSISHPQTSVRVRGEYLQVHAKWRRSHGIVKPARTALASQAHRGITIDVGVGTLTLTVTALVLHGAVRGVTHAFPPTRMSHASMRAQTRRAAVRLIASIHTAHVHAPPPRQTPRPMTLDYYSRTSPIQVDRASPQSSRRLSPARVRTPSSQTIRRVSIDPSSTRPCVARATLSSPRAFWDPSANMAATASFAPSSVGIADASRAFTVDATRCAGVRLSL